MRLTLQNGYPSPYPVGLSEDEQEAVSAAAGGLSLCLEGVAALQWLHTVTVEFDTHEQANAARALTGWEPWGTSDKVLEAPTSDAEGYGHPAIIADSRAWCGFFLSRT